MLLSLKYINNFFSPSYLYIIKNCHYFFSLLEIELLTLILKNRGGGKKKERKQQNDITII